MDSLSHLTYLPLAEERAAEMCIRDSFSIEGGEMTPTLKLKRKNICDMHTTEIEAMYAGE